MQHDARIYFDEALTTSNSSRIHDGEVHIATRNYSPWDSCHTNDQLADHSERDGMQSSPKLRGSERGHATHQAVRE
eukprot:10376420-Alexandrium_andersonii.AAC.1